MTLSRRIGPWLVVLDRNEKGFSVQTFYNDKLEEEFSDTFQDEYIANTYYEQVCARAQAERELHHE